MHVRFQIFPFLIFFLLSLFALPKKKRSAKKKSLVSSDNATDPQVEANAVIDPTSVEVEDSLAVKPSASAAVELTEPVGTVSSKEDILVDNVTSEEVVELGSKENDGKDMLENVRDSTLMEVEGNEPAEDGLDSGPKEDDGKPVVEVSLTGQLELASGAKEIEGKDMASGIVLDEDDSVLFKEAIENDFSDDISVMKIYEAEKGKKLLIESTDKVEGLRKSMEAQLHVAEALVVCLELMLAHLRQLLAIWDLIQTTPTTATI